MKLNYDCIRDLLFFLEDNINPSSSINSKDITIDYDTNTITYTLKILIENDIIKGQVFYADGIPYFIDITDINLLGHQIIDKIRSENVWCKIKNKLSEISTSDIISLISIINNF